MDILNDILKEINNEVITVEMGGITHLISTGMIKRMILKAPEKEREEFTRLFLEMKYRKHNIDKVIRKLAEIYAHKSINGF